MTIPAKLVFYGNRGLMPNPLRFDDPEPPRGFGSILHNLAHRDLDLKITPRDRHERAVVAHHTNVATYLIFSGTFMHPLIQKALHLVDPLLLNRPRHTNRHC